jgi:hypothetical protein
MLFSHKESEMERIAAGLLLLATLWLGVSGVMAGTPSQGGGFVLERVSLGNGEEEANDLSIVPSVTTGGLFVVFESEATNLVANDTNGQRDVFARNPVSGTTERVSLTSAGTQANGGSFNADTSATGQYVVFMSFATDLVAGDSNGLTDVFIRDRTNGTTQLISIGLAGAGGNGISGYPRISPDGELVVFRSIADNLVANDTNGVYDCFIQNVATGARTRLLTSTGDEFNADCEEAVISNGTRRVALESEATNIVPGDTNGTSDIFVVTGSNNSVQRVSVSSGGVEGNGNSLQPSVSDSGLFIAFTSFANNLVLSDTNNVADIFVHNLATGNTRRVSVTSSGEAANGQSIQPFISQDGRYVLFSSTATNLPGGTGGFYQLYIHDRVTGITELVSKDANGNPGNDSSTAAALSSNNQIVVFESDASNLVPDDTNLVNDIFRSDIGVFPPPTATPTITQTPSNTPPPTATPTGTIVPPTHTPTPTLTPTGTFFPPTNTPIPTATPTGTFIPPTHSATPTVTPTGTFMPPTNTPTPIVTPPNTLFLPMVQRE